MLLFYDNIGGLERASEEWNLSKRKVREEVLLRCSRFVNYGHRSLHGVYRIFATTWEDTLCISFSEAVKIHGVRLLGDRGKKYNMKFEVFSQSVEKKFLSQPNSRGISVFDVMLPVPIEVQADVVVHLKAT